ncbi:MAG TPA: MFS transporter [Methanofastidiosum sp.]|nr:MFS transporter [Methanofastidiosum sp.]HNV93981.1 MFS transporter [Methanofastidiosum sp.]HNZ60021.1 MFS transporter [Methanofastidiosum sp.]HPU91265.1 MFS transporter [Methanofastidiosum sp.]HPX24133.1 MFS transporter [Methanofastidiosum sp.]
MEIENNRLYFGSMLGFYKSFFHGFTMILFSIYYTKIGISLLPYALLFVIGDGLSFFLKPIVGVLSDRVGEKYLLLIALILSSVSTFLISFTKNILFLALLGVLVAVSLATFLTVIIIFSLRPVTQKPEKKASIFGGITGLGWVFGLLLPGVFVDILGLKETFYILFIIGILISCLYIFFMNGFKFELREKSYPSLQTLIKVLDPLIYKTFDLAVFSAFLIFFVRFAIGELGMSGSIVSLIVAFESLVFGISEILIGRFVKVETKRFWIKLGALIHILGIALLLISNNIIFFFVASGLIGLAGAFIDIWCYSFLCEVIDFSKRGVIFSTFSLSQDLSTIIGSSLPVVASLLAINPFASMIVFPAIILAYSIKHR